MRSIHDNFCTVFMVIWYNFALDYCNTLQTWNYIHELEKTADHIENFLLFNCSDLACLQHGIEGVQKNDSNLMWVVKAA